MRPPKSTKPIVYNLSTLSQFYGMQPAPLSQDKDFWGTFERSPIVQGCPRFFEWLFHTSSTAQGGGGSFKNRKPIGELGCCESGMAERSHWWSERWLISLTISLSFSGYLPTYLSIYLCISIDLSIDLSIYLSTSIYLSIYPSIYLSLSLFHLSSCLPVYLSTYLSVYLSIPSSLSLSFICLSVCLSV